MAVLTTVEEIQGLGFEWPRYPTLEEFLLFEDGNIDLTGTLAKLRSSQAYYKQQLIDAFNFKMQHGVDYSDFTDKRDDYAQMDRLLGKAIAYLEEINQAVLEAS